MNITANSPYVGDRISAALDDPLLAESYQVNRHQLYLNYGNNVEFERLKHQVLLCPETRDAIYAPPAPVRYRKGSRPELEKTVDEVCGGCHDDLESVLALMDFCRDLYKKHDNIQLFYGGTEEELIKKGERLCECLGRLMVALCEVRGIPGRIVMHIVCGHITAEVWVKNKWVFIDPRCGLFFLLPDGRPASVEECVAGLPDYLHQPDWVREHASPLWDYEYRCIRCQTKYFHPVELQCFCDYSLEDAGQYHFDWRSDDEATRDGMYVENKRYTELAEIIFDRIAVEMEACHG